MKVDCRIKHLSLLDWLVYLHALQFTNPTSADHNVLLIQCSYATKTQMDATLCLKINLEIISWNKNDRMKDNSTTFLLL